MAGNSAFVCAPAGAMVRGQRDLIPTGVRLLLLLLVLHGTGTGCRHQRIRLRYSRRMVHRIGHYLLVRFHLVERRSDARNREVGA